MSSLTVERLYSLLPAIHRIRDTEQGEPLRALLASFARELGAIEDNLEQLYDDQFIETCADWVAPYIGELIGYRPLTGVVPRAEVANTIAFRRRKGTALMLEQLARDVTSWPAHAAEFFEQLATTQHMNHVRLHAPATADLRRTRAMFEVGGPFNAVAHTAEMRRPESGGGRFNIPNVGIFLWRLLSLRLTTIPLTPDPDDTSNRRFRVNPLRADMQLFRRAQAEDDISHLADPINVPEPLSVRRMAIAVRSAQASTSPAPGDRIDDDYGIGESLLLMRPGNPPTPLSVTDVRICDLRDILDTNGNVVGWNHESAVPAGTVGIDPERGRVLLGAASDGPLLATFHYGSTRLIGGGEYERLPAGDALDSQLTASNGEPLQPKLDSIATGGRLLITDSLTYAQTPIFKVNDGLEAVVAAQNGARPLIAASGDIVLTIGARGRLVIDGLVLSGGSLRLAAATDNEPREIVLRDCTLVPGLELNPNGSAVLPGAPSLIVEHPFTKVMLERCITGPLHIAPDAEVVLQDCIVDAGASNHVAYSANANGEAGGELSARESTIIGKLNTKLMQFVSNSILFARLADASVETWSAPVIAERRQEGCVRFSYVPPGSITPRRHRCVPDNRNPDVVPHFTSLRYGDAAYGQLRHVTHDAIRKGASDEGEMGVLHALFQPQREANLRIRLDEYLRFGLHAGFFYAT